jgi:hypothetical protein
MLQLAMFIESVVNAATVLQNRLVGFLALSPTVAL